MPFRVIGLGEVLWDVFPDSRQPGGATSNVAFHAGQLGSDGIVVSRVGRDELGREFIRHLAGHGLVTAHIQNDPTAPTGTATIELTESGHRFIIHEDVAWDRLEFTPHLQAVMQTADAVCFGTLAQRSPASRETIQRCLFETSEECLVVLDINIRQHFYTRSIIERSLQSANIVKLNESEVDVLRELLGIQHSDVSSIIKRLCHDFGPEYVCVTRGENGCLIGSLDEAFDVPGIPVQVVDTVGAGDAFTAGLIVTQLEGWPMDMSAQFANRIGALVASRAGAMPDLRDELLALRAEYQRPQPVVKSRGH